MVLYRHPFGGLLVVLPFCTPSSILRSLRNTITSSRQSSGQLHRWSGGIMLVTNFTSRLEAEHPQLARHLTLANLVKFVNLASEVYNRADNVLKFTSADTRVLPFLSLALQLDLDMDEYEALWNLTFPSVPFAHINPANLIRLHGLEVQLPTKIHEVYLTPPTSTCLVCDQRSGRPLEIRPRRHGYVYDLDGIHSAEFYTWSCLDCRATYRPSYYTTNETRVYYTKAQGAHPDHYQVHCHFGMTYRLAMSFRQSQMLAHISNFNLVNLYNTTNFKGQQVPINSGNRLICPKISQEVARDGVDIFSLLRRCERRGYVLHVSAHGDNTDRLLPAMIRELHYIANNGSHHRDHFCSLCVRTYPIEHEGKNTVKIIRAVVTDGLTIGHWRCTASSAQLQALAHRAGAPPPDGPCLNALPKVTSRFCADHEESLKANEADREHEAARDGGVAKPKGTPVLSRSRTHNDQLIVEAPSALRDYLVEAFPDGLPEVIFYDNACNLLQVIHNGDKDPTPFENTVIPVDPFHHRSHKESDSFFQMYTDPKKFPDLQQKGSWIFNASAGELSNIWYGGFASMCRNMQATRYEFFLEEMVEFRNIWLCDALAARPSLEYIGSQKF
ncbi:uncharacterized protein MELLADRAFT_85573 [Melampsora larici-populina 98AG31]|uniref:CxC5 like cysteine cluster associated with KDZ domain-containing protein n=1 Tax=Melampsora larici-populina (strain 98AG31 / pathotype 3-4-7) TaxID=747676 RepID=F4RIE3_MELLP|nr:uncharacterized protein MELLADRAFT_85573 [Melampsora larici-populina 98AG31]EGG07694.1 hypothetical protein MELLADRAFT_85573 [Melampsora larici-populina 98AG31]